MSGISVSNVSAPIHLAIDLGASSGRLLAGCIHESGIHLEEIHRFENGPHEIGHRLVWNLVGLWEHIRFGLQKAAAKYGSRIRSIGADTWGVDFVLLDKNQDLVGPAFCYRDVRTRGVMDKAFQRMSRSEMFAHTGLQFMELNTAFQMYAMRLEGSPLLDIADRFLMIPDFIHWQLSGVQCNEYTDASTTQLLDPSSKEWSLPVIEALGLPAHVFLPPTQPGTVLGPITGRIAQHTQLPAQVEVVLPASHDTGSAVLAVPASSFAQKQPDWCYISCGTWSLMGVELAQPNLSRLCQEFNFTNEGGVSGSVRLLKNISGLWIVQQCREQWRRQGRELGWSELSRMAMQAPAMTAIIDPDDASFAAPDNMPEAIRRYCQRTQQPVPENEGQIVRCALESLALRYRMVLEMLQTLTGSQIQTVHLVGGGVQNTQLCQFAADACERSVIAGPIEATALGNILVQAIGCGLLSDIAQARELVRNSPDIQRYEPNQSAESKERWATGIQKLRQLTCKD
jgi:rhamnulokinase